MNPAEISEAVILWTGFGKAAWPHRDDDAVVATYGADVGADLLAAVRALADDFYSSEARINAPDLVSMGKRAAADFRAKHPEIDESAVAALTWAYTYDYK